MICHPSDLLEVKDDRVDWRQRQMWPGRDQSRCMRAHRVRRVQQSGAGQMPGARGVGNHSGTARR